MREKFYERKRKKICRKITEWIEKIMNNQNWSTNQVSNKLLAWIRKIPIFVSHEKREKEEEWERVSGEENEEESQFLMQNIIHQNIFKTELFGDQIRMKMNECIKRKMNVSR